ncbi:hypothetical protein [Burkholderia cepacia]|uniref:hypothetical protein n=1 Tax=Burkholderia cepacia TaxID=292 RepID=UPI002AB67AA2|nr:hypothetical protein [Burkholderia cepacia]
MFLVAAAIAVGATKLPACPPECYLLAGALGLAAVWFAVRARARWYGQAVERRALRALEREPLDVTTNVMTQHGDIDAIVRPRRRHSRFAVEIKAWHAPRRISRAALAQASENAHAKNCIPVLWLPNARASTFRRGNVWVVCGSARVLARWVDEDAH